jgi:hypothetical protein
MRHRAGVLVVLAAILVSACTRGPAGSDDASVSAAPTDPTPTALPSASLSPSATPAASLDPEVEQAVTFRRTFGLRFDLPFVIASLTDPAASNLDFGLPVYPDEAIKLQADLDEQNELIPIVVGYASRHPDESGGVYIDRDQHVGMVTSLWTDHLPEHAAALATLLDGRVTLVLKVRYSEAELRALEETVFADMDWMEAIPARMQSLGVGTIENAIMMDVSSAEPTAIQQIADHYGLGDKLVVTSDGTGVVFIPYGIVKGKIRTADGKIPKSVNELMLGHDYDPAIPGQCGGGDIGYGVTADGAFEYPCQAGVRVLTITGHDAKGGNVEVGRKTVTVIAGQTVRVTIRVKD